MKLLLALVAALAALSATFDDTKDKTIERGRVCCQRFFAGEIKPIWDEFDDAMRKAIGTEESLQTFYRQATGQLGAETSLVEETAELHDSTRVYVRRARFEKVPVVIEVVFSFDDKDKIAGFLVRPVPKEAPSEFLEYETKTELRLPFDGEWFVFWGGRTLAQNYHTAVDDQRFAYDIVMMREGSSHQGDGKRNEDYFCFGQPILAPGSGVVVTALDGIEDNEPGKRDAPHAAGNHVILDHGNGEFSLLAHFINGTVTVKPGDRLKAGDPIAKCGNSGNSSEPHLHYHLQNGPEFKKAKGLPALFQKYVADGQSIDRGEPVKGQRIAPK